MIERLTEKANKALVLAQEESRRLGHNFVGTEQILVGLCAENTGVAAKALKAMGVSLKELRIEVEKIIGRGPGSVAESAPFTPRAKRVMELSWQEARQMGDNYIGTEHLLLGVIREEKGSASKVLTSCKVDPSALRLHILRMLDTTGSITTSKKAISETPALDVYGIDLSQACKEDRLDPVVARDAEISRLVRILGRRSNANPLLLGERGVGKSAIVNGLARRIEDAEVPEHLAHRKIIQLDLLYVLAQKEPGALLKECLAEAQTAKIILAVDEIHVLLHTECDTIEQEASYIFNWFVSNNKVSCIGIAPITEYRKTVAEHGTLKRHFQPVTILPPSKDDALQMLRALRSKLEHHHDVYINDAALEQSVKLSVQHIKDAFLPAKAVDVLDEACQLVSLRRPSNLATLKSELLKVRKQKEGCIRHQQFDKAATLREQETALSEKLRNLEKVIDSPEVTEDDIAELIIQWTQIT